MEVTELATADDLVSARTAIALGSGPPKSGMRSSKGFGSGSQIGRFVVSGELGAGGMGVVYAAYDPTLDRKVAIKMLHEGISGSHRQRLEREARAMAKLSHPNVVAVHEVGDCDSRLFVAMEFIDGCTLRDWLIEKKPDRKEILRVMLEAGRGLAAAHEAGMVHRDFKPDNVLVGKDGRVRVSDFGLVTPLGAATIDEAITIDGPRTLDGADLTQVGTVMGTPLYMAPEQHQGKNADHRADQFSFCVTLWDALYKKTPYSAPSYEALVDNVTSGKLQSPPKATKGAAWIRAILTRGLSVEPEDRFSSMNELLAALERDPWRIRRRVGAALALLSLSGAAAFVLATSEDGAKRPCKDVHLPMQERWSSETREQIRAAFAQSGVAEAERVWPQVDLAMDRYAREWSSLRTQSCLSAQERGDAEDGFSALAIHCFEGRLSAFAAVVELFTSAPNESVIRGASKAIDELDLVSYCTDPAYLEDRNPLPDDQEQRAAIAAREKDYERIVMMERRGGYQDALTGLDALVKPARTLAYAPLLARVLLLRGAVQQTLGDLKSAENTLREAASAAASAKDDTRLAEVWIHLLDILVLQGRYDEALSIETVAITSAQRIPEELGLQARLHNTLGGIYVAKARYDEAYTSYDKALQLQRQIGSQDNHALAPAISNLGLALWYRGDINGAKLAFEEALEILLADYGPDHSHVAYARKNIADLHMQLGHYEQAAEQYDEVVRIWKTSLGEDHVTLAYAYEQMAIVALRAGKFEEALRYVDLTMGLRLRHLGENNALTTQARTVAIEVYLGINSPESLQKAEAEIAASLEAQSVLGEAGRRNLSYVLDSRARLSELRQDWSTALRDSQRALELRLELLGDKHVDVAYSYGQIVKLSLVLGNDALAERNAKRAQEIFDANPGFADQDALNMRRAIADIRLRGGDRKGARRVLLDAVDKAATCDCATASLRIQFELAKLDAIEGDAGGVSRAQAIRDQVSAAQAGADLAAKKQLDQQIGEMDLWLASPAGRPRR